MRNVTSTTATALRQTRNSLWSRRGAVLLATFLATFSPSCGDATEDGEPGDVSAGPLYLAATRIWDDTTTTSYFHVLPSLKARTQVNTKQALEIPGSAKLYAAFDLGWFAIGGGEAPIITRYTLDAHGALVAGGRISFQNQGVSDLWDTIYFVSPTKAYYPDRAGQQLIVWDPTAMEITGRVDLARTDRPGYLSLYGYAPILRGDTLLISVGWFDWEENDQVLAETGLVAVDTRRDKVVSFEIDTRCGGITQPISVASGDTYLVSSALAGAAFKLGRLATEPCALRIRADQTSFDADYLEKLATLTNGALAGEPVPAGGDALFLRILDEELATALPDGATWEITGQPAWRWARWDVAENTLAHVTSLEPATADVLWFQVGASTFGTETKSDYSKTTLIDLTAKGGPKRALTAPGFLHGVARIR